MIDAVAPDDLGYVDIHSREFGIQGRPVASKPGEPALVALRPVSTWKGRLKAQDPKHARGWHVRAWTNLMGDRSAEPQTTGYVETTSDDEGRFALDPIAVGALRLELKPPGDLPVQADLPRSLAVRAGREESLEIPLKRTVTVSGLYVERGTRKGVAGISLSLSDLEPNGNANQRGKTDENGRYSFQALPGRARVVATKFPKTHVQVPGPGWEDFTVPEPPKGVELPTREALPAAPPLRGQVVDEVGRPVPGASVHASWLLTVGGLSSAGSILAKADDKGEFLLEGLGPDASVSITGQLRNRRGKSPVNVRAGTAEPVKVAIAPMPVLGVAGRVLGPGAKPLVGIPVKVEFRVSRDNAPGFPEQAQFTGMPEIITTNDGSFKTPQELERKPSEFRIEVVAEGYFPGRTAWVAAGEADVVTLPDLVLKRSRGVRVVSGRVVDRAGKPVQGATVSQAGDGPVCTSTKANTDGHFRLAGVGSGEGLVFAEAPGFQFGGAIVGGGTDPVEIRLARENEPPIKALKTLPAPLPRAEERALARELLEPLLPLARSGSLGYSSSAVIPTLARVDPKRVLDMLENRVVTEPFSTLIQVALGQLEDDPDVAIATIQDDLDPASTAAGWLALESFRPALDRARRECLLERALANARKVMRADLQVPLFGQVADRWLELGSIERARPILVEGQAILAALPKESWLYQAEEFANVLAVIDLPAATALFERKEKTNVSPTDAATLIRHKAQVAIRLAAIDPATAERLIGPPSFHFYERPDVVLTVARKMAGTDLPRARRLMETIADPPAPGQNARPELVSFGLGAIAGELAKTQPVQARELLDEAYSGLRKIAVEGRPGTGLNSVANLMAELLPNVERLEPERL
ncbi:MAG TPA: carboxypeptidase-like regulatory domain-containing protein, partial [Isosphaeraceae bacterium]|nr:carboxypeptidase-like regulatory domain-containing protein [Isosphaeraceae bacterium]